jgi:hypothetical protein
MPCCAFAAFLVSQIYLALLGLRRLLRGHGARHEPVPSAVMWRLGPPLEASATAGSAAFESSSRAPRRRSRKRSLTFVSLAAIAELAIMTAGVRWFMDGGAHSLVSDVERLTSAGSFADLAVMCGAKR